MAGYNPYLDPATNYGPVPIERFVAGLQPTSGKLPRDLDGEFVRNGPNPSTTPAGLYHWFDGDGMLHGNEIQWGDIQFFSMIFEDWPFFKQLSCHKSRAEYRLQVPWGRNCLICESVDAYGML